MVSTVEDKLLDYTTFVSFIKEQIKERMGEDYNIRIFKVMKNNNLELDSLVVLKEGKNFAPNIYLNAYYESYIEGTSMLEIIDRISMIYDHCTLPDIEDDFVYTLESMQSYIFFRLISIERNKKLLAQVPHIRFLDLALTFHCLVRSEDEGIGSIRITNEHIEQWAVSCEELMELARENTVKLFPPVIRTMEEMFKSFLCNEYTEDEILDLESSANEAYPMYILTNEKGINGASCLLYKDVIRGFAEQIKSDLYILPSSIHEIILVPRNGMEDKEFFNRMVMDINCTQVPAEEVLSDNVYMYSLEKDAIFL